VDYPEQKQAEKHAAEAEESQLPVLQRQQALERAAPAAGGNEREQALEHQYEGQSGPEDVRVQDYFFAGATAAPEPLPRNALKNSEPAGSITITSPFLLKLAL
jgi:hypothetical protein